MRRLIRSTMFLGLLGLMAACAPAPPPPPPAPAGPSPAEMVSAANDLDKRFVDAFNKADVDALMATYWNSPDLVSFGPDGMGTRGWDAAKAAAAETFKAIPGAKIELVNGRNDAHGGVVIGTGTWKMTIPAAKGPATVLEGRFSDVKAQKDGKWVFVMDHASVPLPPPPGPGKK